MCQEHIGMETILFLCWLCIGILFNLYIYMIKHLQRNEKRGDNKFKSAILKYVLQMKFMSTSCEITLRWMPQNMFNEKSTLVQVMAWCCQAPSHYLSQCWPQPILPYRFTKPQSVQWLDNAPSNDTFQWHRYCQMSLWYWWLSAWLQ